MVFCNQCGEGQKETLVDFIRLSSGHDNRESLDFCGKNCFEKWYRELRSRFDRMTSQKQEKE